MVNTTYNRVLFHRNKLFFPVATAVALMAGSPSMAADGGLVLEEVVVTANKRAENLQDVAATVTAVQGDAIDEFAIRNFEDITKLTAGIRTAQNEDSATHSSISMRGITYNRASGANPAVDVYWNGVNYRSPSLFTQMFDIERLEVLRGPQGTLQGKTSPAGAIKVETRRPDFENIEGQVKTTVNDEGDYNLEFGVSLPVSDTLSVRVAGFTDESAGRGIESVSTGDEEDSATDAGRVTIAWKPSDAFAATLTSEYLESDVNNYKTMSGSYALPLPPSPGAVYPELEGTDRKSLMEEPSNTRMRQDITVLNMSLQALNHEFTSVTGYWEGYIDETDDRDTSNWVPGAVHTAILDSDVRTFIQEMRISSSGESWWEYMGGLYYQRFTSTTRSEFDTFPNNNTQSILFGVPIFTEEFGAFTHNRIDINERSELQVGLRWSKHRKELATDIATGNGFSVSDITPCPDGAPCDVDLPRGFLLQSLIADEFQNSSDTVVTGSIKYLYDLSSDVMLYTSLDRSYRPGGIGVSQEVTDGDLLLFDAETSDALEVGFKSTLFEGRVQLNGAVYYQQFDGYIGFAENLLVDANGDTFADTRATRLAFNADATSLGAELEAVALVSEQWRVGGAVSYNDFTYDSGEQGLCSDASQFAGNTPGGSDNVQIASCDIGGQRVGGEPNWSVSFNSEYTVPLNFADWFIRGLYNFTDHSESDNVENGRIGAYSTVDLYTGLRSKNHAWEVSLWVKNLLDKEHTTKVFTPDTANLGAFGIHETGYTRSQQLAERSVGATLRYNFSM